MSLEKINGTDTVADGLMKASRNFNITDQRLTDVTQQSNENATNVLGAIKRSGDKMDKPLRLGASLFNKGFSYAHNFNNKLLIDTKINRTSGDYFQINIVGGLSHTVILNLTLEVAVSADTYLVLIKNNGNKEYECKVFTLKNGNIGIHLNGISNYTWADFTLRTRYERPQYQEYEQFAFTVDTDVPVDASNIGIGVYI